MFKESHSESATTIEPVAISNSSHIQPEFIRLPDLEKLFGIKRSTAYNLIKRGSIKSVTLRQRGSRTGIKLISVDSVRRYLNAAMEGE